MAPSLKLVVEVDGGYHRLRAVADARRTRVLERTAVRIFFAPTDHSPTHNVSVHCSANAGTDAGQGCNIVGNLRVAEPRNSGYTPGMKTAISLPDEVFKNAEKLASRLKVSRSELYARALQDYVRQHAPDAVTEAYNRVCSEVEAQPDEFIRLAARKTLKRAEW